MRSSETAHSKKPGEACGSCCTKIDNLGVSFGKKSILQNISLHLHCGEMTALVGPNGGGKTTLLKAILGQVKHTGSMQFLDEVGTHTDQRPLIGYVPQSLNFDRDNPVSVLDLFTATISTEPVWLGVSRKTRTHVIDSLSAVEASHLVDRKLGELSGGELQRILLSLALEPLPNILLLDEPVSGVDQNGMRLFYKKVSELRKQFDLTIVLVSHDLDLVAEHADRVALLDRTILSVGKPEDVYSDKAFREIFGPVWAAGLFGTKRVKRSTTTSKKGGR